MKNSNPDPAERARQNETSNAYYSASKLGPATYDQIYARRDPAVLEFYVSCADKYGGPVLEIGAGTGQVTWAIAKAGIDVVGIDLSQQMLDIAIDKAGHEDQAVRDRIEFHQADMVEFQLDQKFKTILIPGRSFMHLKTPEEQRSALSCIHSHLHPGGVAVISLFDPKVEFCLPGSGPPLGKREIVDEDTGQLIRQTFVSQTVDPLSQTLRQCVLLEIFDSQGARIALEETSWCLRWTYQQEMRYLFELTGFEVEELYSDVFGNGPEYGKEQIWISRRT